jgi:hypothetical protein
LKRRPIRSKDVSFNAKAKAKAKDVTAHNTTLFISLVRIYLLENLISYVYHCVIINAKSNEYSAI